MIETIRQGLKDDGVDVPITKLCEWFGVPRGTVYYKPVKKMPVVQECFAKPIKDMIEENPSFGYRTVAGLLGFNKNTVQRIFQLKGWQCKKRPVGFRPRIQAQPSVANSPDERWSTDLCRFWLADDRATLVGHKIGDELAYADLWLITQSKHFIISNSTFSSWGAWLGRHPVKQVIAPGFLKLQGKMAWGFDGLLPEEWIKL